jgi:hypothetical protein
MKSHALLVCILVLSACNTDPAISGSELWR